MCRHLAYLGPPRSPAGPLLEAPHSLLRQSYAPADMRGGGSVNADGFGLGWYAGGEPVRYRRPNPLWTDSALPALAASLHSTAFLAAVRSATVGMPVAESACAPFEGGRWLFSHNGLVRGWPGSMAALAGRLPVTELLTLEATTDSALLWALLRARLDAGVPAVKAVAELVADVEAAAPGSRLNLLLTDGEQLVATAWTHALSVLTADGAVLIASEPFDDHPGWTPVPDRHLVHARGGDLTVAPIEVETP
ncbi:ergothioneine biosynthesis protein EgtC [Amycolatopsis suaedae]|uniref:Gamma-glutamyl-hercynylcysteine sulfoxide hydrolase n=1 Tax=Amycolatopsis suaedae TaxID=2510978 RepID=A0A4Q7JB54_9PSEU|nr:ergothioneine biosynthesis protein EgtC [Amycolatopsis suaedae]RZQ63723.1 ergothioneine biosynthesis protein EgtC [Amycolatopsis suaedae]